MEPDNNLKLKNTVIKINSPSGFQNRMEMKGESLTI